MKEYLSSSISASRFYNKPKYLNLCCDKNTFVLFKTFSKQSEALAYIVLTHSSEAIDNSVVVSFEIKGQTNGARKFILTTWKEFWHRYWRMKKSQRVYYEVIQQDRPCRLYFDLEYDKTINQEVDGERIVSQFKDVVVQLILDTFQICISNNDIVDLDSSNDQKFSRHLIFHTGKYLFANNYQVGEFVKYVIDNIHNQGLKLQIKDKEEYKIFVDLGVYSKNRNFRLFLSSKLGKSRPLLISSSSGSVPIGNKVIDGRLYRVNQSKESEILGLPEAADERDVEEFFMNSLVSPWPIPDNFSLITFRDDLPRIQTKKAIDASFCNQTVGKASNFPEIDCLILDFVRTASWNPNPFLEISKSLFFPDSRTLVYYFLNDRYCHRIGRQHKSNGVYYTFQLDKMEIHQKCFDPDCRYYQSPPFFLNNSSTNSESELDKLFLESLESFERAFTA